MARSLRLHEIPAIGESAGSTSATAATIVSSGPIWEPARKVHDDFLLLMVTINRFAVLLRHVKRSRPSDTSVVKINFRRLDVSRSSAITVKSTFRKRKCSESAQARLKTSARQPAVGVISLATSALIESRCRQSPPTSTKD